MICDHIVFFFLKNHVKMWLSTVKCVFVSLSPHFITLLTVNSLFLLNGPIKPDVLNVLNTHTHTHTHVLLHASTRGALYRSCF